MRLPFALARWGAWRWGAVLSREDATSPRDARERAQEIRQLDPRDSQRLYRIMMRR